MRISIILLCVCSILSIGCVSTATKLALEESRKSLKEAKVSNDTLRLDLAGLKSEVDSTKSTVSAMQVALYDAETALSLEKAKGVHDQGKIRELEAARANVKTALNSELVRASELNFEVRKLDSQLMESAKIIEEKKQANEDLMAKASLEQDTSKEDWLATGSTLILGLLGFGGLGGLGMASTRKQVV